MSNFINFTGGILGVLIFSLVIIAGSSLNARAGVDMLGCTVVVVKQTNINTQQSFDFFVDYPAGPDFEFSLLTGEADFVGINIGDQAVISEDVPEGWELESVNCDDGGSGINVFVDEDNQVIASCIQAGTSTCAFNNVAVQVSRNVPTLSEWGIIAAAAGLGLIGLFFAVRRRKAAAA